MTYVCLCTRYHEHSYVSFVTRDSTYELFFIKKSFDLNYEFD